MRRDLIGAFTTRTAAAKGAVAIALAAVLAAGCGGASEDPEETAYRRLNKALAALENAHRADVEVDVYVRAGGIPQVRMNAEMRGSQRTSPDRRATDLDLTSVKTTIERDYGDDLVRTGSVRVIVVDGRTYVRNTLESTTWRSPDRTGSLLARRGFDPSGTGAMLRTTMVAAMFRSKGRMAVPGNPTPTATAGLRLYDYYASCTLYDCLRESPDLYAVARQVYPVGEPINLRLLVDGDDRPRILLVESSFPMPFAGRNNNALVDFRAKLTFHDHGEPQQIAAPVS